MNASPELMMATIGVENLEVAARAYCEGLGYVAVASTSISAEYAAIWGDQKISGLRSQVLQPASGTQIYIRLIETNKLVDPVRRPGWFAIELCVKDSEKLYERLSRSDYFSPFASPKALPFSDMIYPFQCLGANGEVLYLNETRGNLPEIDLPLARSDVDHIFIAVLSAENLVQSSSFYEDLLGISVTETHEIPYKTINRLFNLPLDQLHLLNTLGQGRTVFLEIDQYPKVALETISKKVEEPAIQNGIVCLSFRLGQNQPDYADKFKIDDLPYAGRTMSHIKGPNEERIELIAM